MFGPGLIYIGDELGTIWSMFLALVLSVRDSLMDSPHYRIFIIIGHLSSIFLSQRLYYTINSPFNIHFPR